jgi:hypothetical protein
MPTPSLLIVPARFKSGKLYSQIPTSGAGDFTVTRATEATRVNASGLIELVASGIPRLDYFASGGTVGCPALLIEPSAQNLALQSRDLSQAVWVKTNVTATKNAVGADGSVSGATTLTATAASGTVLQAIINISQSRVFSAYVRRVSGTGAIQMTTNGGTNWTTVSISSIYTQVACAAQTVLNGSVGFRMAVSGDVIEVDYTQGEVGPIATSAIPTTTGSVTRNADVVTVSGAVSGSIGQTQGTLYAEVDLRNFPSPARLFGISDGTSNNRIILLFNTSNRIRLLATIATASQVDINSSSQVAGIFKIAVGYALNDYAFYINGVQVGTDTIALVPACSSIFLGNAETGLAGSNINDRIRAAALYNTRLTNAELAALTTL